MGGPTCVYNVLKGLEPTLKLWYVLPQVSTLCFKLLFPWRRGQEDHQFSLSGDQVHETTLLVGFNEGLSAGRWRMCYLYSLYQTYFQYLWFRFKGVACKRPICPEWRWRSFSGSRRCQVLGEQLWRGGRGGDERGILKEVLCGLHIPFRVFKKRE